MSFDLWEEKSSDAIWRAQASLQVLNLWSLAVIKAAVNAPCQTNPCFLSLFHS